MPLRRRSGVLNLRHELNEGAEGYEVSTSTEGFATVWTWASFKLILLQIILLQTNSSLNHFSSTHPSSNRPTLHQFTALQADLHFSSNYMMARFLALGLMATAATAGPCDIYSSGGTPCVAAFGTTRALYDKYDGCLYQVSRASDNSTQDIHPLSAGGVANATSQDEFCKGTTCEITIIYDQSGKGNDLSRAPKGTANSGPGPKGSDAIAPAAGAPVKLNGKKAYGAFIKPQTGYRNDDTKDIAKGDEPEGMYAVLDATHYNGKCCFDFGNAEVGNNDTGAGHMETINFSNFTGKGAGNGPWVMADLENGVFSGQSAKNNPKNPSIDSDFVTAWVKGRKNDWAIRTGNATGGLETAYSGVRPDGYATMHKEGAIILGVGGDNSNRGEGTFYEGVITSGFPSDATEEKVQADIVAAKYQVA